MSSTSSVSSMISIISCIATAKNDYTARIPVLRLATTTVAAAYITVVSVTWEMVSATAASSAAHPFPTQTYTSEVVKRTKLSPELRLLAVSGT